MNDKHNESLKRIYEYFGLNNQRLKLLEEITEYIDSHPCSENEFEEMCDVWIVSTQLLLLDKEKSEQIIKHKIERTLKRMETGYYEK